MEASLLAQIVAYALSIVLVIISAYFGRHYTTFKAKLQAAAELLADLSTALEDGRVTVEEAQEILNDVQTLLEDP